MKVSERIAAQVATMQEGRTFGYADLELARTEQLAGAKAMERLLQKGSVARLSKGLFYKPQATPFGKLRPAESELLKPYLFHSGRRVAYVTGLRLYNQLGLTTQVSSAVEIASFTRRLRPRISGLQVLAAKSYVEVTSDNYQMLEALDAVKDFSIIPDMDREFGIAVLRSKLLEMASMDTEMLLSIALRYPPRVRAMMGALLDGKIPSKVTEQLLESLNPLSWYKMGLNESSLPNSKKWNIR